MRNIATDVARSVVCVYVWTVQNEWTDRYAVWAAYACGPKEMCQLSGRGGWKHWPQRHGRDWRCGLL